MSFLNSSGGQALLVNIHDFTVESAILDSDSNITAVNNINNIKDEIALKKALTKISDKYEALKYFVVFSSPWSVSQTHSVRARRDAPFMFSEKDFDEILKNENSLFLKNLKNNFNPDYFRFMEADIMKVFLNGYEIKDLNPFKKKIKNIELLIYMSAVKKEVFDAVSGIFKKKDLTIKTRPAIFNFILKDKEKENRDFLIADVKEETTEIVLVRDGCIEEIINFNKGYNFFVRRIINILNISLSEAISMFGRYNINLMEENKKYELKNILKSAENDFRDLFSNVINELSKNNFLPKNLWYFSENAINNQLFEIKNRQGENIFEPKEILVDTKNHSFLALQSLYFKKYLV